MPVSTARRVRAIPSRARADLRRLVEDAATVTHLPDPTRRFERLLVQVHQSVSFDNYIVVGLPEPDRGPEVGFVLAERSDEAFRDFYFSERWFEHDATVQALCASTDVVTTASAASRIGDDPVLRDRFDAVAEAVGRDLVGLSVWRDGRPIGSVVLRRDRPFSPRETAFFGLVAPALHLAASALPTAAPDAVLSARERECLAWTSQGKTAWEIGMILGISEHTAVTHLNAAVRKLAARNRLHAVAEALRRRLID